MILPPGATAEVAPLRPAEPRRAPFQLLAGLGFFVAIAALVAGAMAGYSNTQRLIHNARRVTHTQDVIAQAEALLSTMRDAETGQRGFLLTGDARYLGPYEIALRQIPAARERLRQLTADNREQQARVAALQPLLADKIAELRQTVALAETGRHAAALDIVRSDAGRQSMDALRDGVATIEAAEQALLAEREHQSESSARTTLLYLVLTALIGVGLVVVAVYFGSRALRGERRGAAQLARHRNELRVTLASIGDAVITTDMHCCITSVNTVAESLTGWTAREAVGQPLDLVFHIVDQVTGHTADNPATRALEQGVVVGLANHTLLVAKDGSERPIDDSASPIRDANGNMYGVVLVFRDVTERRHTEQTLRDSRSRLEAELADTKMLQSLSVQLIQERRVAALYERIVAAAVAIMRSDFASMQVRDPHTGALRLLAHHAFGPEAARFWATVTGHEGGATCGLAMTTGERVVVQDVLASDRLKGTTDLDMMKRMGIRSVQSTPLVSRDGTLVGAISTHWRTPHEPERRSLDLLDILARQAADLIERTRAEGELLDAQESLRTSDRRKDEFLAILAHELRNPLSPVRNAANVLMHKPMADAEARRSVEMIDRQVAQMARLIDDLLDVSRITRGIVELHLERVDFADVARAVLDASEADLESRGHTLSVRMPREPIALRADRHRLIQVFGNLIGNAAKYTPAGGHISFDAHVDGDVLEAVVRDDGVGIPPAKLSEIFELFAQVDRSLERETGLGIGLTLARQLVELHRGTIEARSEGPGTGSAFIVRLPIDTTVPVVAEPEERKPAVRSRRILVVDDNRDAAESLALLLDAAGHTVRFGTDGGAALGVAEEFRPEAAFIDIGMPRMNGYELAQRLRAEPWGAAIYLAALTGWGQEADRRRSGEAGFDAHIVKPASPGAIDEVLEAMDARAAKAVSNAADAKDDLADAPRSSVS